MADRWLNDLTAAIKSGEVELTADYAARIWKSMGEVDKALRKAGFPRIKRPRAKSGSAPKGKGGGLISDSRIKSHMTAYLRTRSRVRMAFCLSFSLWCSFDVFELCGVVA